MLKCKNKSIVFVINSLEGGGAERVICNLLQIMEALFTQNGYKIYLVLLDQLVEEQTCPDYVNKVVLNSEGKLAKSFIQLNNWVKTTKPDAMVSFLTRSNLSSVLVAKLNKIPCIVSERVNTTSHFSTARMGFISKTLIRFIYPMATVVVPVSKGVQHDLVDNYSVPSKKCTVMYNAYNQAALVAKSEQHVDDIPTKPFIVGIGRLMPNKNFALLINAFAASNTTRELVILGQGPEMPNLTLLISELKLESRVHLLGFKENPYPYLASADYLVSTSNAEGFPNGIAEAMCLKKPVIATNCQSGPAEILTGNDNVTVDGYICAEHGILCEVNNVNGVTLAINEMELEGKINFYQQQSINRSMTFSYDAMKEVVSSVINKALLSKTKQQKANGHTTR